MSQWSAIAKLARSDPGSEKRKFPRFRARSVLCDPPGEVLDFSATGVRVVFRGPKPKCVLGDRIDLMLISGAGEHKGEVEIMRVEKIGFRRYEVGMRFTDPEAAKKMQLFKCGYDALEDGDWTCR